MDIISTEVVTGIISLGSIYMSVSCIIVFSKEFRELLPKLTAVESKLNRLRDGKESSQSTVTEEQIWKEQPRGQRQEYS